MSLSRSSSNSFGFAIFNGADPGASGVFAVSGGPHGRFSRVDELPDTVTWFCNLDYPPSPLRSRSDTILPLDLFCLAANGRPCEVSADLDSVSNAVQLATDVLRLAARLHGTEPGRLDAAGFSATLFSRLPPLDPLLDKPFTQIFRFAWRPHHAPLTDRPITHHALTAYLPMPFLVRRVLAMPLPVGPWIRHNGPLPRKYSPPDGEASAFLCELGARGPAFVRLAFRGAAAGAEGHLFSPLCSEGVREWFTVHEAATLASLGDVSVREVLVGARYLEPEEQAIFSPDSLGPFAEYAPAFHLYCLALTRAMASPAPLPSGASPHPLGIWVQSWVRLMSLPLCRALEEAGFTVIRYGLGQVSWLAPPETVDASRALAQKLGLWVIP